MVSMNYSLMAIFLCIVIVSLWNLEIISISIRNTIRRFTNPRTPQNSTLEALHKKIWNDIELLQNKGDCESKKILHCQNVDNYAGFGSMTMRYGACMQIAYALKRIFFIHQPEYEHFGGLFRFLKNESSKCGYLKNNYKGMSSCNLHNANCYLDNGYDINNTYKVLEYNAGAIFPTPRVMPGTIPKEFKTILESHDIEYPWLWFTSQFLGYLLLRLQPSTESLIKKFKESMEFGYPYTALHIRHGKDKLLSESKFVKNEKYMEWIDSYQKKFLSNESVKRVYAASDDRDIVQQLKQIRPKNRYMHLPNSYIDSILPKYKTGKDRLIYQKANFPGEVIESAIIELLFMAYSNYTVCHHTSNMCRLQWSLKFSLPPYTMRDRAVSADGHLLDYYQLYGYVAPFNDYWMLINDSPICEIKFPNGNKMMNYTKNGLVRLWGNIEVMHVKNRLLKVRMGESVNRKGGKVSGYVLVNDVISWPGNPSYL